MTQKEKKERMQAIVAALEEIYPVPVCALEFDGDPWKLLVMGRLSAQCTDARVNIVCRDLFARFPTARDLAYADQAEVEKLIYSCGFFRAKAQSIIACSRMLVEDFDGEVPSDMEVLLTFPGVGRKIANLLRGDLFGLPVIVADTHCIRLGGRFGMYPEKEKNPARVEAILAKIVAPEKQSDLCHRLVQFGRDVCTARAPRCDECPICHLCEKGRKKHD